jgi:peptidoglycan/xylan/chitin deacetylase (PgdA/CDA1 family)
MYAGEVGVPRLLKLFEKYGIKTTWFIPGTSDGLVRYRGVRREAL